MIASSSVVNLTHYPDGPTEAPPSLLKRKQRRGNWRCEQKVDGWRIILCRTEDGFVALTRFNKNDYSEKFCKAFNAELESLLPVIPIGTQLDGEWFNFRNQDLNAPSAYFIFDVLKWGEDWQINNELHYRINLLEENIYPHLSGQIKASPTPAEGECWLEYYKKQREDPYSEGVVVKCLTGRNAVMVADRNGRKKAHAWFKIKYRGGHDGQVDLDANRKNL